MIAFLVIDFEIATYIFRLFQKINDVKIKLKIVLSQIC